MTRFRIGLLLIVLLGLGGSISLRAQTNRTAPDFQEVYDLIRQHITGVGEAELNRAAVQGMVAALRPKVALTASNSSTNGVSGTQSITEAKVFDGDIAYLRITRVDDGLAKAVEGAYQQLNSTNQINGIVLDLRYAEGLDYEAATAVADLFVTKKQPLLNEGKGVLSSHEKSKAITAPVGALVNHETSGAAEALAAMIREIGAGLILGSPTAGEAMAMQDFPLKDGEHLRIASAPITLGDGTALSAQGIKPDIDVTVSVEAERAFYADAFLVEPKTSGLAGGSGMNLPNVTNQTAHVRLNEAELVREHKAGESPEEETAKRLPEPQVPVVSDPALARALDLLKGLAVVRQNNS